jgi:hypothetical protein
MKILNQYQQKKMKLKKTLEFVIIVEKNLTKKMVGVGWTELVSGAMVMPPKLVMGNIVRSVARKRASNLSSDKFIAAIRRSKR